MKRSSEGLVTSTVWAVCTGLAMAAALSNCWLLAVSPPARTALQRLAQSAAMSVMQATCFSLQPPLSPSFDLVLLYFLRGCTLRYQRLYARWMVAQWSVQASKQALKQSSKAQHDCS